MSLAVVEDQILNGYNNPTCTSERPSVVVEDQILNGYNNNTKYHCPFLGVVEDQILNGYNNIKLLSGFFAIGC